MRPAERAHAAAAVLAEISTAAAAARAAQDHVSQLVHAALHVQPRVVTAAQIADVLGVSRRHVYTLGERSA